MKACNLCKHFMGYGLHWVSGVCPFRKGTIDMFDYRKTAEECLNYTTDFVSVCEGCKKKDTCPTSKFMAITCTQKEI